MVEYLFYTLFFLVPLVFYPKTSELFEFNKLVLVYFFTALIVCFWIIKMIQWKKIIFKRTVLDIPLLLFLGSQVISTIFSIDSRTSVFGYYSRFNGGLLSTICYALLYSAFVSNFSKQNLLKLIKITLISATIVAIYGILEHFGHSFSCLFVMGKFNDACWVQDVKTRVFATLGQPNWLSAFLVSLLPLTWYFALQTKIQKERIIWIAISLLFFACILFTESRSGIFALAVAFVIFWILSLRFRMTFKIATIVSVLFLIIAAVFGTPVTPSITQFFQHKKIVQSVDTSEGGTESGAIRAIVWKGAFDIWRAYPLFGTGVETFGYSYWQFRPVAHNNTSEWDFLYNKAHNEYLNFAANTGTFGLISYLILIGVGIYSLRKYPAFLAGYVSILITNFFGFSVVVISLMTFLFPAFAGVMDKKNKEEKNKNYELNTDQKFGVIIISAITIFILFLIARYWYADYIYNQGKSELEAGLYNSSLKDLQTAINYSPTESTYHNALSRVFTQVSVGLMDSKQATVGAQIVPYATNESDIAFNLSPRNMNIRESRISMYLELAPFDSSYLQNSIDLINETIPLSPTDPKLPLLLGKAYANSGRINDAIIEFKKALSLKPDYGEAQNDLAVVEKIQNKK